MNLFVKNMYCLMQQKMLILYLNNHHDLEIKNKINEFKNNIMLPGGPCKPGGPLGPCMPCFPGGPGGPK